MSMTRQQTQPLHVENTVMALGKEDLSVQNAFRTYRDMKLDGVISGSMSFIKGVVSNGTFNLKQHENATSKEVALTEALNKSLDSLEGYNKRQLISNWLTALDYGCSLNEVTFKREGSYNVFANISPIHLTTVQRFEMKGGKLVKLHLTKAENDGLIQDTSSTSPSVQGDKVLFFRIEPDSDFPLGKSLLYGCYTSWKTKKILQEYEAIGVAKNLSGVLEIRVPSEYLNRYYSEPASEEARYVDNLLAQAEMLHAGKGSYILTASDTNVNGVALFEVTTVGGSGGNAQNYNVGSSIDRYNREIQLAMQTTVLSMGAEGGGSFALSDNSTHLMSLFVESIRSAISTEFKKAIKQAWALNGVTDTNYPELVWDEVEPVDWEEFTRGWQRLVQSGAVTADKTLEAWIRKKAEAPEADYKQVLQNPTKADDVDRAGDKN